LVSGIISAFPFLLCSNLCQSYDSGKRICALFSQKSEQYQDHPREAWAKPDGPEVATPKLKSFITCSLTANPLALIGGSLVSLSCFRGGNRTYRTLLRHDDKTNIVCVHR
jgi:hypothetical protein